MERRDSRGRRKSGLSIWRLLSVCGSRLGSGLARISAFEYRQSAARGMERSDFRPPGIIGCLVQLVMIKSGI